MASLDAEALGQAVDGAVIAPRLAVDQAQIVDCAEHIVAGRRVEGGSAAEFVPHLERFRRQVMARVPGASGRPDQTRRPFIDGHARANNGNEKLALRGEWVMEGILGR